MAIMKKLAGSSAKVMSDSYSGVNTLNRRVVAIFPTKQFMQAKPGLAFGVEANNLL